MSRTEDIDNGIWSDPDFEGLSAPAKLVFIWSWTNPRCGWSGVYKISPRTIAHECGLDAEQVPAIIDELTAASLVFYEQHVMWVRARVKRLRSRSPQMAKAVAKDVQNVPDTHPLRARFLSAYRNDPWLRDTLKGMYAEGNHDLSQNPIDTGNLDTHPTPSLEGAGTRDRGRVKGEDVDVVEEQQRERTQLPDDFPSELTPHLDHVVAVLSEMAEQHDARAVKRSSVAHVLMTRRLKPLVKSAHDCAGHFQPGQGRRRVKDVVATYREWLDRAPDMARIETLPGHGSQPAPDIAQVTPFDSRRKRVLADRSSFLRHYDNDGRAIQ